MQVEPVDPRDVQWEVNDPRYRVYFWRAGATPAGFDPSLMMWESEEFELTGAADLHEVVAWANAKAAPDRTYSLYVVVEADGRCGLVRLSGVDPTAAE